MSTEPRTEAGRRLFTDNEPMDMLESDGVTPADVVAIEQEAGSLDAAWTEAEAALPERWHIADLNAFRDGWQARASNGVRFAAFGRGPTPTAALVALTERLKDVDR